MAYALTGVTKWFWYSTGFHLINTIFSYAFGIYIGWGLLRAPNGLREKITFSPMFYYFAVVADFFLRGLWLIALFMVVEQHPWLATFEYATLLAFAEFMRRWLWAIIRIENA